VAPLETGATNISRNTHSVLALSPLSRQRRANRVNLGLRGCPVQRGE